MPHRALLLGLACFILGCRVLVHTTILPHLGLDKLKNRLTSDQWAEGKLRRLDQITPFFVWNDLTQDDWLLAADTWATLTMQGRSPGDADLLIAVFAARRRAVLVTNNVRHFSVLADPLRLTLQNWPITAQN
jgi:predicted nucleic acid-binding protein